MFPRIGIVGDFRPDASTHRATDAALAHAASALGLQIDARWLPTPAVAGPDGPALLASCDGLWIAPGSPYDSLDGALRAIRHAREEGTTLLATCGGFQHVVLEHARNVLGMTDAAHAEVDPEAASAVVTRLECSLVGRTGTVTLRPGSRAARWCGDTRRIEEYRCSYGVAPGFAAQLDRGGLSVSGRDDDGTVRVVERASHPGFVATLFVPQMGSRAGAPHPLVTGFLRAASGEDVRRETRP